MAVPRKRIKLDRTVVAKQPPKDQPVEKPPKAAPVSNLKTRSARQLDEAFEIMEQIPYRETAGTKTLEPAPRRTGFRWKISLEAVLPDNTSAGSEDQSSQSQRSSLIDLGFTIPFFWGWPIFGAMTKSFLKNFEPYRNLDLF